MTNSSLGKERDLSLSKRIEGQREKIQSNVIKFELDEIKKHFDDNISDIQNQFDIIHMLDSGKDKDKIDCILRSQIVFLGSSLDFYFHELTKFGLMKIYHGIWGETDKYNNFQVSMQVVSQALKERENSDWFIEYINKQYQNVTMMSWDSIKSQINLIGLDINSIAKNAFYKKGASEKEIDKLKRRINDLFKRRNFIAHQFDRSHNDAVKIGISTETVVEFIEDVKKIVYAVHEVALSKD